MEVSLLIITKISVQQLLHENKTTHKKLCFYNINQTQCYIADQVL